MFDLSLFRKPAFTGVSLATFAIGGRHVRHADVSHALSAGSPRVCPRSKGACGYCP